MEKIFAKDLEVGDTVVNVSGDKYTVAKLETNDRGQIEVHDSKGLRNVSGKKVVYHLV